MTQADLFAEPGRFVEIEVVYRTPDYGDIIPGGACPHDPEFRVDLGVSIDGPGLMTRTGGFCFKCGHADLEGARDWWDAWLEAKRDFGRRHWGFDRRLNQLACQAIGVGEDMLAVHDYLWERAADLGDTVNCINIGELRDRILAERSAAH